ncbi:MAG: hypothetical protein ABW171_01730 [Steroidobacter sp.]
MPAAHGVQIVAATQELQQEPRMLERQRGIVEQLLVRFERITKQETIVQWTARFIPVRTRVRICLYQAERHERARQQ